MRKIVSITFVLVSFIFGGLHAQNYNKAIAVSNDIEILELTDNTYLHRSFAQTEKWGKMGANGMIIVKGNEALLIDTPWDNKQTEELYNWVKDSLNAIISTVIISHWHEDRMGGLEFLQSKGVKSYANHMTIDIAKEKGLPLPDTSFTDSLTLNFNATPIVSYYIGGGHSTDNIFISLPSEDILFGGCAVKDEQSTTLGNLSDADLAAWPSTIKKAIELFPNTKTVIPGHGEIGGLELLLHTQHLLDNK